MPMRRLLSFSNEATSACVLHYAGVMLSHTGKTLHELRTESMQLLACCTTSKRPRFINRHCSQDNRSQDDDCVSMSCRSLLRHKQLDCS